MKKSRFIKRNIALLFAVFCLLLFSGCGKIETPPPTLIIIAGVHSNSQKTSVPLERSIRETYQNYGSVAVIIVDGDPRVERTTEGKMLGYIDDNTKTFLRQNNGNFDIWTSDYINPLVSNLTTSMKSLGASDEEVDTMSAFIEAVKVFNEISSGKDAAKEIIIYDTGLCTSGALSFLEADRHEYLFSDERIDVEKLHSSLDSWGIGEGKLNLSGVKVTWYGLGEVAAPQPDLDEFCKNNLRTIWGEILRRAGAEPGELEQSDSEYHYFVEVTSTDSLDNLPEVSTVIRQELIDDNTGTDDGTETGNSGVPETGIKIPEDLLRFKPDEAEFEDVEEAKKHLECYAKTYLDQSTERILLVGTTADPNRWGGDLDLSRARAEAVRDHFISLGVDAERFEILGWGARDPLYDPAEWETGFFDSEIAKRNRTVRIYPLESNTAKYLLNY